MYRRAKVDIFALDKVIVPINQSGVHWTSAVINFMTKRVEYYDSMSGSGEEYYEYIIRYIYMYVRCVCILS
jgi:Ulp1 family protease